LLAMIFTEFVMMILMQKALLGSEISRTYAFLSAIDVNHNILSKSENAILSTGFQDDFAATLNDSGFSCLLVMDENLNVIYSAGNDCESQEKVEIITRQTIRSREKTARFFGSTWGGMWWQSQDMIVSAPLFQEGKIVGAGSIMLPLTGVYEVLRQTQYVLLIYIVVNSIVFTFIGFFLMSRVVVKPLQRLVKRAEEYQDDDEMFFLPENQDSEFSKLSKALNRMLRHLAEDKEKLRMAVVSLEQANLNLKQAQKDIIRAEKLASVGRLSAGIAHEIGNPMGIIIGYLELLKNDDISNEDKKEFLLRTETEIKRIDTTIRRLLDFSRPSSEDVYEVSVHEIIEDTVGASQFHPRMSDIDLDLKLSAGNDCVMANPNQLRQVFLNIIINSADAILSTENFSNGKISISTEVRKSSRNGSSEGGDVLKIDYADNGPGIPKTEIENVFDPFFTTKGSGKGTGLGLYVCFMIVEGLGGRIGATSREGEGTTITVYLPLCPCPDSKNG